MQQRDCFRGSTTTRTFDDSLGLVKLRNSYTQANIYYSKKDTKQDQQGEKVHLEESVGK